MSTVPMVTIAGLDKTYPGGTQALQGMNLEIPPGMFGLLGPNGAGKTTLMKILATLLEPDAGTVRMGDLDLVADKSATRRILGYLPQEFGFYPGFTAEEMLTYLAKLKGLADNKARKKAVEDLLERVNLGSEKRRKLGTFSGGMRQRFGIAQALLGNPQLLIVDEPTAGLDPEERNRFHNLLSELASNIVVLLSTHIVLDVSNLCTHMAIIRNGRILFTGVPTEAVNRIDGHVWEMVVPVEVAQALKTQFKVIASQFYQGNVKLRLFCENGKPGEDCQAIAPTLEDFYFCVINNLAKGA